MEKYFQYVRQQKIWQNSHTLLRTLASYGGDVPSCKTNPVEFGYLNPSREIRSSFLFKAVNGRARESGGLSRVFYTYTHKVQI